MQASTTRKVPNPDPEPMPPEPRPVPTPEQGPRIRSGTA